MSNAALIIVQTDGVEFYTDSSTGNSGISQSGLAILCGVNKSSISRLTKETKNGKAPEYLKPLQDRVEELTTQTTSGMILYGSELCIAIIRYYDRKGNEIAQYTFDKFAAIGFNNWVQGITGWQSPTQPQYQPQPTEPKKLPWKPLELFPSMSEETFKSLDPISRQHFAETNAERAIRVQMERTEEMLWVNRYQYKQHFQP